MAGNNRQFDIVLLGPTGYTGKLCAKHIVQHLPTTLKWAIAGRSAGKLETIAKDLRELNPDRLQPETLVVQLNSEELDSLAQKTKVIINCVGPYHLYSTPVVEACANNGTHYVDATGETPWVKAIIEKYHDVAKSHGAIIIPSVGLESAPADILAWSLVKRVREELSCDTREIVSSINEMTTSGPSGGTLSTILTTIESLSFSEILKAADPFSLAAAPPPKDVPRQTILETISGVRSVPDLGTLTTSPSGIADITIVHRSATLMRELYGPRFYFRQFLRVRNALTGVLFHYGFLAGLMLLLLPPVRWALKKYLFYAPGQGPRMEDSVNDMVEYCAVATPDQRTGPNTTKKRVFGKLKFNGTMYAFTGLLLSEAAMTILENEEKVKRVSRGGIVTSATLGQEFVDRLDKVGCHIETRVFEN